MGFWLVVVGVILLAVVGIQWKRRGNPGEMGHDEFGNRNLGAYGGPPNNRQNGGTTGGGGGGFGA